MKAARIQRFGPANLISIDDLPQPEAGSGELLVRVKAAGVGHWDALIREGKVKDESLPRILGSEVAGTVEAVGAGISGFKAGGEVYGATNEHFTGGYTEYALASARRTDRPAVFRRALSEFTIVQAYPRPRDAARLRRRALRAVGESANGDASHLLLLAARA